MKGLRAVVTGISSRNGGVSVIFAIAAVLGVVGCSRSSSSSGVRISAADSAPPPPPSVTDNPVILGAVPGPASSTDYFNLTTTFILTGQNLSPNGDNTVQSDCPGGGLNTEDQPNPVEILSDAPTNDGTGDVALTLEFAIPTQATSCAVVVTRPDGVSAPAATVAPYWLGDPSFTYVIQGEATGGSQGIPAGAAVTLEITGAPDSAPIWLGWYNSPSASAGGQAKFKQVDTDTSQETSATGTLTYPFGGPTDPRDDMGGGYYLIIVIEHQLERIYWPV